MRREPLPELLARVRDCRLCADSLPHAPRPVVQVDGAARLLLVGQAPGRRVHESGIPWDDASGERLRGWLGIAREQFYDASRVAIVPVGFCYPGKGKSGDLPPRPECAPAWHSQLLAHLPHARLTLLIGRYAQASYLRENCGLTLTQTVEAWRDCLPRFLPLPHPSPRNQAWWKARPWFEAELVPELQRRIAALWTNQTRPQGKNRMPDRFNTAPLPDSAQRVADLLRAIGHDRAVVLLPATGKTSAEAAAGLGCSVAEIAKSIVFRRLRDDSPVMVIASGANRVDEARVTALVGALGKADARFVRERIGYAIGGVCPIGHLEKTVILIDRDLFRFERVWAAAGHPHAVFDLSPQQLLAMTGAPVADVALRTETQADS